MSLSRSSYKIKRFLSTADPDFAGALQVYVRNTAPAIRTNTNEIASWLDNCPTAFEGLFYIFGFYLDRKIVGYAEVSYFPKEYLLVFDYIVVDKPYRRHGVFFEFIDQLRANLEGLHPDYCYAVAEVGYGPGEQHPSQDSQLLERLLKLLGFRIIRAPYYQPRLALNDVESEMPADLLVFSADSVARMHTETYLRIVRTLYYDYYSPWYSKNAAAKKAYQKHLDRLYSEIEQGLKRKKYVTLNGHNTVLQGPEPQPIAVSQKPLLVFTSQALILVLLLTAGMLALRSAYHLSDVSFAGAYVLALLSFLAVGGIVSKEARLVFGQTAFFIRSVFGKKTVDSMPTEIEREQIETHDQSEP